MISLPTAKSVYYILDFSLCIGEHLKIFAKGDALHLSLLSVDTLWTCFRIRAHSSTVIVLYFFIWKHN